jgi:hypothetical protein
MIADLRGVFAGKPFSKKPENIIVQKKGKLSRFLAGRIV